jgi:hypothetical protein
MRTEGETNDKGEQTIMPEDTMMNNSRRRFVTLSAIGLAVAPLGSLLATRVAEAKGKSTGPDLASEVPRLPENDKQAMALGYREDGDSVDATKFQRTSGQSCQNCQLYSGTPGDAWGPCAVFSYRVDPRLNKNYVVSGKGWCRSWAPRLG